MSFLVDVQYKIQDIIDNLNKSDYSIYLIDWSIDFDFLILFRLIWMLTVDRMTNEYVADEKLEHLFIYENFLMKNDS